MKRRELTRAVFRSRAFATLKGRVAKLLRGSPTLYATASKLLYAFDQSFRTLSPGTPEGVEKAWQVARERQGANLGDYYEFGVFRGYVLWYAQRALTGAGVTGIRYWGFDSFEGLPPVAGIDREQGRFHEGQFACSLESVEAYLREAGANMDEIRLVKGFFSESLTPELKRCEPMRPVGVALIDCDLYSSTAEVLAWLSDLLQDGSLLLFDDWHTFGGSDDLGQPRAFGEFLTDNPTWRAERLYDFSRHGRAFLMQRHRDPPASQ